MKEHTWPPVTPRLTVDAVIRLSGGIVLIKRKNPPHGWALPGGFVDVGETVETAVRREAEEETGLVIEDIWLIGVYSDPARDSRFHTVSVAFGASADGVPHGADDAKEAVVFKDDDLPAPIAFDHRQIIEDFLKKERKLKL
ncbi:NUDIX hydrolase [bacterium]|nr:NUDIX hydrolase [bacterium]